MLTQLAALTSTLLLAQQPAPIAEIPFRIGDDAIIADATVNGINVSCMFDTGFSGSFVLNESVNVGKADGSMTLVDFVGSFEASTVSIKNLKMGPLTVPAQGKQVVQMGNQDYSLSYGQHVVGIMGLEVFSDYVFQINYEQKKFIVYPKSHDITKAKTDNQKSFLLKMLPKGNNSIELTVAAPNGGKMYLALDTGNAFYATTHKDVLEKLKLWTEGEAPKFVKQSWVASGPVDSWDILMKDLKIYNVPVAESVWNIIDLPASSADHDGTVGYGFLKNFNITIDMERRHVLLENFSGEVSDPVKGDVGISAFYYPDQKRMIITRVSPNSPAEKAGIKRGDSLIDIDGDLITYVPFRRLMNMLAGESGSTVKVATSRNGNLTRHELKREPLVNTMKQ